MNFAVKLTQLNGLVGDIMTWVFQGITNVLEVVFSHIFLLTYQIVAVPIFLTMDIIQLVFKKFAGLDSYVVGGLAGGEVQSGDIVLTLINTPTIQNVFWALLILGIVLLIIVTIVALVRAETQSVDNKDRKSHSKIFSDSIRALFNFIMVPVVAILGIFMGNALLRTLDSATSGGNNTRVSSILFRACAYECNRARLTEKFAFDIRDEGFNSMGVIKGSTQEEIATAIDEAFANFTHFDWQSLNLPSLNLFSSGSAISAYLHVLTLTLYSAGTAYIPRCCFSVYDTAQVFYYYSLPSFNWLMLIIGSLFILWVLLVTSIGLIKRIFKLIILLVISPPIVAVSPLDSGATLGRWKKQFIGSVLSAYGTIVGLNLVFLILGPLQSIQFLYVGSAELGGISIAPANMLIQVLILVAALLFFKNFVKELSEMIGAENSYETGAKATGEIAKKVGTVAAAAVGAAGAVKAAKAAKAAKQAGAASKQKLDQMKAAKEGGDNSITDEAIKEQEELMNGQFAAGNDYDKLASDRLKQTRNSALSLATNGMSDVVSGEISSQEKAAGVDTKTAARASKLAKAVSKQERAEARAKFAKNHPHIAKINRNIGTAVTSAAKFGVNAVGKAAGYYLRGPVFGTKKLVSDLQDRNLLKQIDNENLPDSKRDLALEKYDLKLKKKEYGKGSSEYQEQLERYKAAKEKENERVIKLREEKKKPKELANAIKHAALKDDGNNKESTDSTVPTSDDYKYTVKPGYIRKTNDHYSKIKVPKNKGKKKK